MEVFIIFINEVSLESFSLFKSELIMSIINEMDLNDNDRANVLQGVIDSLDETLML